MSKLFDGGFDQLDHAILDELQLNSRISVADLARKIHLSPPAVHQRIKRLERAGVIKAYVALLDRDAVGYDLLCFIRVSLQPQTAANTQAFTNAMCAITNVLECYRTAGSADFLLKVAVRDHKELDQFIQQKLVTLPGVDRVETSPVLHEMKATTALKLK